MGPTGLRGGREQGRTPPTPWRPRRADAPADDDSRRDRAHRVGPRGGDRRGHGDVTVWSNWVADQCARIASAGQWRRPRDLDAAGPTGALHGDDSTTRPV